MTESNVSAVILKSPDGIICGECGHVAAALIDEPCPTCKTTGRRWTRQHAPDWLLKLPVTEQTDDQ